MAIDTVAKRASTLSLSTMILPPPDGTIAQADRQSLTRYYSGILAGAAVEVINKGVQSLAIRIGISI